MLNLCAPVRPHLIKTNPTSRRVAARALREAFTSGKGKDSKAMMRVFRSQAPQALNCFHDRQSSLTDFYMRKIRSTTSAPRRMGK